MAASAHSTSGDRKLVARRGPAGGSGAPGGANRVHVAHGRALFGVRLRRGREVDALPLPDVHGVDVGLRGLEPARSSTTQSVTGDADPAHQRDGHAQAYEAYAAHELRSRPAIARDERSLEVHWLRRARPARQLAAVQTATPGNRYSPPAANGAKRSSRSAANAARSLSSKPRSTTASAPAVLVAQAT